MVDIRTEIRINCPVGELAAFAIEPDNAPIWYENIKKVEWKSSQPLQKGSLLGFQAKFLGKNLEYVYEVVEWEEDKRFVMRTADGPFPMETTYEFLKIDALTSKIRLRNKGIPKGFSKLMAPFMKGAMRRANNKDLLLLKATLEKKK